MNNRSVNIGGRNDRSTIVTGQREVVKGGATTVKGDRNVVIIETNDGFDRSVPRDGDWERQKDLRQEAVVRGCGNTVVIQSSGRNTITIS